MVSLWVYYMRRTWNYESLVSRFRTLIFYPASVMTLLVQLEPNPWTTLHPLLLHHHPTKPICFLPGGRGCQTRTPFERSSYSRYPWYSPRSSLCSSFSSCGGGDGSGRNGKIWRRSWRKRKGPNRTLILRGNIGPRRNYGRGLPHDGRKTSDSLQGGDETLGYPTRRFTCGTIRKLAFLVRTHQPIHPPVQHPHRSHHPAPHPRRQPLRPLILSIPHSPELTTNHGIFISNLRHLPLPPHLLYLQHTNADPTCQ